MTEILIALGVNALSIFCVFKIWKSEMVFFLKASLFTLFLVFNVSVWNMLFPWEFGSVYALCFASVMAWLVVAFQRKGPLKNTQIETQNFPYQSSIFSWESLLKILLIFFISVFFAGSVCACIALLLPMFLNVELANSLVGGLFLFLLIWPASMVWVVSRTGLLKLSIVSSVLTLVSVSSIYLGSV